MPLDEITASEVAQFRADLVAPELGEKRINNILAVLSKPLEYAVECEVITRASRSRMFRVERPEIVGVGLRAIRSSPRSGEGRR